MEENKSLNEGFIPPSSAYPNIEKKGINPPPTSQPKPKTQTPENPQK